MAKLTKAELISAMALKAGITKTAAETALTTVLDTIESAVTDGDKVELRGFGTFSRKDRAARQGRNPRTGEAVAIPASSTMHFKASKSAA